MVMGERAVVLMKMGSRAWRTARGPENQKRNVPINSGV